MEALLDFRLALFIFLSTAYLWTAETSSNELAESSGELISLIFSILLVFIYN